MGTLLVRNARVLVTMDAERREIDDGGLFAEDGFITQVGTTDQLPKTADEVVDLTGHVVLPGLVNTHHHFYQTLYRNLPAAQETCVFVWLQAHYRLWSRVTPEAMRLSTQTALAELALSGCTTAFDHSYVYPKGGSIDEQVEGAREIGLRFHVSRGGMSLGESKGGLPPDDCVEDEEHILKDTQRVIEKYHDTSKGSLLRIVVAPCSPFSVTADYMREAEKLARSYSVGMHTHLCESFDEEKFTLDNFGMLPVEYMESLNWLGSDTWYAHAIHVYDDQIRKMAETQTGVAHCPCSNMRLASGIAPMRKYLEHGVPVSVGVDGSASNDGSHMLNEVRMAMLLARVKMGLRPPEGPETILFPSSPLRKKEWLTAREALEIATRGGARVLGRDDIGSLEPGKCADFISFDMNRLEYAGAQHDPVAAVLFCASVNVDTNVVHGEFIVKDRTFLPLELRPLIDGHNRMAENLVVG
jgi:8-oxoguanine deaminase